VSDRLATEVILIAGRSGVGKSTTAYEVSRQLAASHVRHALIEGDNLDQAYPAPWRQGIPLAERNLAAMWLNYRELGYSKLIYTNTVSVLEIATLRDSPTETPNVTWSAGQALPGRGDSGCVGYLTSGGDEVEPSELRAKGAVTPVRADHGLQGRLRCAGLPLELGDPFTDGVGTC